MKNKLHLLFAFIVTFIGYAQTGIGAYSTHDGGFENHVATLAGGSLAAANLSTSLWTANTTANNVKTSSATGGRSGSRYVTLGSINGTLKNFYSPQIAGAFAPNTTYQIQFWYKSASTTALVSSTVDLFVDNTSATQAPPIGTKQSVAAGLSTSVASWTKVAVAITTNATPAGNFGVAGFTIAAAAAGYSADFDDFVIYQSNSPDTTAPNSPGAITATAAANAGANVSWAAASGGVDGGGYIVVRYATTAPSASDDPIQNGIYKAGNTVGNGLVRYTGAGTSFSDTGLSAGVDYFYKVYTVDKAFNYSDESVTSTPVQLMEAQFNSMAIVGDGVGGWPTNAASEIDAQQMTSTDGVHWSIDNLVTSSGGVKFRASNSWVNNWGATAGSFPTGTAVLNGSNITVPIGIYNVTFNSTTLAFNFSPSNLYPAVSLSGAGVGNTDVDLGTSDGVHYSGIGLAVNGEVKFRQNHTDIVSWTPPTFPSGTAVEGTGTLNVVNNVYNVSFNRTTLQYSFNFPSIAIVGNSTPQGWPVDPQIDTHILTSADGIHYVINSITLTSGAVKFRQDNGWTVQWGGDGGFPNGTGSQSGIDINIPAGTYSITLNRTTGAYSFGKPIGATPAPDCTLIPVVSATATTGNAALAADGNSATQWESAATDAQSLTVDLGTLSAISAVTLTWDTYSAKNYFVRGSVDGTNWVTIAEKNNMAYGARIDVIENIDAQYRYIKMDGVTRNTQYGYSIYELNVCGTPIAPDTAKRILFIGNSYTYYNNLPTMVKNMAASTGDKLDASSYTVGGTSLEEHFANAGTTGALKQGGWDYVVLQDQSQRPALEESYVQEHTYAFATKLADMARVYSPCTELFFYQTWGRKNGDAANCPTIPEMCTYEGMDNRLALGYAQMANDNDATISPVGSVRRLMRQLHPEIELYDADESHPTLAGTYVAAVTFYTVLLRKDPTLITYNTSILSTTVANQIKEVVKTIVYNNLTTWKVGAYDPAATFTFEAIGNAVSFTNNSVNAQSYVWDFGDGTTSTEENPQHNYANEGPYTITLTALNCDKQSISTQVKTTLGTSQFDHKNITVYPNPAKNSWNIASANDTITNIRVVDIMGKVVMDLKPESSTAQINATQLSAGIYFAKIATATGTNTLKLIKN